MSDPLDEKDLMSACHALARVTLGRTNSHDVIETVAEDYFVCALTFRRRFSSGSDLSLLPNAVWFIAESLGHHEVGRNVQWFDATLDGIVELLLPTRRVTERGEALRRQARIALGQNDDRRN